MRCKLGNVDRLSSLSEDVLSHILSFMDTKFAVRTSSLSKRWRYTWTLVTNLDFDFDEVHPINRIPHLDSWFNIVDRVFELCKTSKLNLFRLRINYISLPNSTISKWISEVVRLNVCELDIKARLIELPLSLFTCNTLTTLRLFASSGGRHDRLDDFNVPSNVKLPVLKTLYIKDSNKPSASVLRLIHGCPVLESLSLSIVLRDDEQEYTFNILSLKRLELTTQCVHYYFSNKVVLNVPNLEYLFVGWWLCSLFVMEDLSSLVEATVSIDFVNPNHLMAEFLKGISGVKSLVWSRSTLDVFMESVLPQFPNLRKLDFEGSVCSRWLQVIEILESVLESEHLCIQEHEDCCWIKPQSVPNCMVSNLRTMKVTKYKGRKYDIEFLEYMLGNAEGLKTLTITCESIRMKDEMRLSARLLKLPRASRSYLFLLALSGEHLEYSKVERASIMVAVETCKKLTRYSNLTQNKWVGLGLSFFNPFNFSTRQETTHLQCLNLKPINLT